MTRDYIDFVEDELSRDSVFKAEHVLSVDYVPERLPHRENEMRHLASVFKTLIQSPGKTSPRFIIDGPVGTGKTAVAKRVSDMLVKGAQRRGINLHKIHINCRINKSTYLVYLKMLREFKPKFPRRGHSPDELLQILIDVLDSEDRYLLLILDELDYFVKHAGPNILYDLTRLMDDRLNAPQRLSVIGVGRDIPLETMLDPSTLSTLQRNVLHFTRYTSEQLHDILNDRITEAFVDGAVLSETIDLICDIAAERGDARYAIELLWRAGKQADSERSVKIIPDYVRQAKADTHPELRKEVFSTLPLHNRFFLLAAARLLKENRGAYVITGEVEEMYRSICEEYNLEPRSHTQVWEWIQDLAAHGVIDAKRSGAGLRGQTTLLGFSDVPAEMLERFLQGLIESDLEAQ